MNLYVISNFLDLLSKNYSQNLQAILKNRNNKYKYYFNVYMIISQDQQKNPILPILD